MTASLLFFRHPINYFSSDPLRQEIKRITGLEICEVAKDKATATVQVFSVGTVVQVFLLVGRLPADSWDGTSAVAVFQYVALTSMVIMAAAAGAHLRKELLKEKRGRGREYAILAIPSSTAPARAFCIGGKPAGARRRVPVRKPNLLPALSNLDNFHSDIHLLPLLLGCHGRQL
jgi:hypothetical protein